MKKILFSLAALIMVNFSARAEISNDLIVFSNEGYNFYLILNGVRYNEAPASRVTARGLNLPTYKVKIIFENKKIPDHNTNLYFYATGKEIVFALVQKSKKKHSMDYVSERDLNPVTSDNTNADTNNNTTEDNNSYNSDYNSSTPATDNTSTNTNTTNTTDNTSTFNIKAGNLNIGVNDKGGISIGTKDGNVNMNTSDQSGDLTLGNGTDGINIHKAPTVPKTGCATPMSDTDFETIKKSVSSQDTDANKLIAADVFMENSCFTASQVKEIMKLFSEDDSRLEFAKKAYPHTSDLNKYNELKETFSKEEKKKEFAEFVKKQK